MLLLTLLSAALATGISSESVPCPLGEGTVKRFHKVSSNTLGGYDSDLAAYSTRGQFRTHAVSTCPDNFFSALGHRLDMPLLERDHAPIKTAIEAARSEWIDRENPTVWERYDTAARIALALNQAPVEVANLYLNAAWTARDAAVGIYVGGLSGPEAAKDILRLGKAELEKKLTPEALKMIHYNMARVAHRGGFVTARKDHIKAFLALSAPTAEERAAGERLMHLSQDIETRYQERAVSLLKATINGPGDTTRLVRAEYQLADTLRRLNRFPEARGHFEAVRDNAEAPDELRELSRFLLSEIGQ